MEENENLETNTVNANQIVNTFEADTLNIPSEYKPITMWGYFGYQLLFAIPCIGFILLCVFAFGGTPNVNLKNFARSYFCFVIIIGVIVGILLAVFAFALGFSKNNTVKPSDFGGFGSAAVENSSRAVMP